MAEPYEKIADLTVRERARVHSILALPGMTLGIARQCVAQGMGPSQAKEWLATQIGREAQLQHVDAASPALQTDIHAESWARSFEATEHQQPEKAPQATQASSHADTWVQAFQAADRAR